MKKFIPIIAAAFLLLTACNALNVKNEDEPDSITENKVTEKSDDKNNLNDGLHNVNNRNNGNNGNNPYTLDQNTKIKYNGVDIQLQELPERIDNQLENDNAGVNFKVIIEAEDDNTQ